MNPLFYSFQSFSFTNKLEKIYGNIFVFGKSGNFKSDLANFTKLIDKHHTNQIIGIAKNRYQTTIESKAINKFNNGQVSKDGQGFYELYVPSQLEARKSHRTSHTFCNWTVYKISEYVDTNKLDITVSFIHIKTKSTDEVLELVKKMIT